MENEIQKQTGYSLNKYVFKDNTLIFTAANLCNFALECYVKYEYSEETKEVIRTECYGAIIDHLYEDELLDVMYEDEIDDYLYHFDESDQSLKDKLILYMTRGMTNDLITSCNGSV